eukprot:CAMPEP_0172531610 /NCGR_PEP_ID=MMETSP1067-20121228/4945_1 /TAXON_ID=265564 ORGANISM="Thalassiosira punctigera, Strain Tpunct2005C2" /NCGR_SAMPLE_ID=MMETSP1067 /ASSEMBLY_ACC=CAM_ASM_000444 /LENGTH=839 /DNA_ID=CAMNT_0013316007 /DNA_START=123 /DNA_END=2642 /DNA_ORIENTATION=+
MGKISTSSESEPIFSPLKTTDDDDDEEHLVGDGGPTATRYRDDTNANEAASSRGGSDGPPVRYRDDPGSGGDIFDWGESAATNGKETGGKKAAKKTSKKKAAAGDDDDDDRDDTYQIDEFDADAVGFSPVSLHDDDSDDDEENGGSGEDRIRLRANKILNRRIFDDTTYEDDDDRIFVGGGWGRHGSQFSLCPHGLCSWCTRKSPPSYSTGPPSKNASLCRTMSISITFMLLVFGAGYLGYQAGLPVEEGYEGNAGEGSLQGQGGDETSSSSSSDNVIYHPHTKGEEWLQWLEKEKDEMHMPRWNFTLHHKQKDKSHDDAFKKPVFEPMTQSQLLGLSENVFQACSERSVRTAPGRSACLSLCHGHYCCFEKDPASGSCVAEQNSYCFAYAACENVIEDFKMNNVAGADDAGHLASSQGNNEMKARDVQLLDETCSVESVATPDGKRDCTTFCRHHLCCFDTVAWGSCSRDPGKECQAYDSCKVLVDDPGDANAIAPLKNVQDVVTHDFKVDCLQSNLYQNWDLCKGHCSQFECCFRNDDDSCYEEQSLECDEYYVCAEFFLPRTWDASTNTDGVAVATVGDDFKRDCMNNNLAQNLDICRNYCVEFECCFMNPGSCYEERQAECDAYYYCEEFYFDKEGTTTMATTMTKSDRASMPAPITKSQGVSTASGGEQGQLPSGSAAFVRPAAESHGVYDHGPANTNVNADIETAVQAVCELEATISACQALCADHLCCFGPVENNCRDRYGEDVCAAYQGCMVLVDMNAVGQSDEEEQGREEVKAVTESCVPKARRDPWLAERCRKACDARSCCFETSPGNCSNEREEWCDEFVACEETLYT